MIHVIGCGGIGSWLVPQLVLLNSAKPRPAQIMLHDGDKLERKNLSRQLFTPEDIGKNKAEALAEKFGVLFKDQYYAPNNPAIKPLDWLFVCVDNHPARLTALRDCDNIGCLAIIAANETNSAEAYAYVNNWRATRLDPRVYYPELLTDHSGDPLGARIGCTGAAQVRNPQLVTANAMAASLAMHLYVAYTAQLDPDTLPHLPFKLNSTLTRLESHKIGEMNYATR